MTQEGLEIRIKWTDDEQSKRGTLELNIIREYWKVDMDNLPRILVTTVQTAG